MPSIEKSELLKNVLQTLISISSRKTDLPNAVMNLDSLIKQLGSRYDFLKHVQINDDVYSEMSSDIISVMSDINTVPPTELGSALHAIINSLNRSLGSNAGHFFIKEIRNTLRDDHLSVMKEMGVDLALMQLESEVMRLERNLAENKK